MVSKKMILAISLVLLAFVSVAYAFTQSWILKNSAIIAAPGLEFRNTNGDLITTISWGQIQQNSPTSYTVNIKNTGSVGMTLAMTSSLAATDGTLTWDKETPFLAPGADMDVTFTLIGKAPLNSPLNFDITITGSW